jgi:hypothetical protein
MKNKPKTTKVTLHEMTSREVRIYLKCPKCKADLTKKGSVRQWNWIDVSYFGQMKKDGKTFFFDYESHGKGGEDCNAIEFQCAKCDNSIVVPEKKS